MKFLEKNGWDVIYGPAGGGSITNRLDKTIAIDGSSLSNAAQAVQLIAHEIGLAQCLAIPDVSSKTAYLSNVFENEGAAIMKGIQARREILANGGPDIGLPGHPANHAAYNAVYNQYLKDGDAAAARTAIGNIFAKYESPPISPNQTYREYYGDYYDKYYGER